MADRDKDGRYDLAATARLSERGVEVGIRARLAAAADALLGRKVERLGLADVQAINAARREENLKDQLLTAYGEGLADRIRSDPSFFDRVHASLCRDAQGQLNLDGIFTRAEAQIYDTLTRLTDEVGYEDGIRPEWFAHFARYASDISNEELQEIWARILAGEIARPGQVALPTLRILSELDADIAGLFSKHAQMIVDGRLLIYREKGGSRHMWDRTDVEDFVRLEEHGLVVQSSSIHPHMWFDRTQRSGFENLSVLDFGDVALALHTNSMIGQDNFELMPLTRAGQTFAGFLGFDKIHALKCVSDLLPPADYIAIYRTVSRGSDKMLEDNPLHVIQNTGAGAGLRSDKDGIELEV